MDDWVRFTFMKIIHAPENKIICRKQDATKEIKTSYQHKIKYLRCTYRFFFSVRMKEIRLAWQYPEQILEP